MPDFNQAEIVRILNMLGAEIDEEGLREKLDVLVELGWATVEEVDGELVYSSTDRGRQVSEHLMNTDPECAMAEKVIAGMGPKDVN